MSDATDARCEGVFRCGTLATYCRKQATPRRCGKRFCDGCAHWNRFAMDTRETLGCPQLNDGQPCPNPRGHNALGWCDEHAAAYETMANNLRTEIDGYK